MVASNRDTHHDRRQGEAGPNPARVRARRASHAGGRRPASIIPASPTWKRSSSTRSFTPGIGSSATRASASGCTATPGGARSPSRPRSFRATTSTCRSTSATSRTSCGSSSSRPAASPRSTTMGEVPVHALRGIDFDLFAPRARRAARAVGQRQVDAAQHPRRPRHADRGRGPLPGPRPGEADEAALTEYRREHVGFVFQFYNLIPSLTARENVALVTEIADDPMTPEEALALVGLEHRLDHFPSQLSGGEQQRVAIARAIAKRPTCCCATSRPARSTSRPASSCSRRSRASTASSARRRSSSPTTPRSPRWPTASCGSPTGTSPASSQRGAPGAAGAGLVRSVISALDRKLLRDLWGMKGQAMAIALVMAAGVTMFVMYLSNFESLRRTQAAYYEQQRFADVFASLKRAPERLSARIARSRRGAGRDAGRGRRDARRARASRAGQRPPDLGARQRAARR
jgi:energy-coupling factor transporter ATP-binding protein EcfA2